MKMGMRRLQLFILLFTMCSLLFQLPSEAFADSNSSGSVKSIVQINDSTTYGPDLSNNDLFGWSVANIGDLDGNGITDIVIGAIQDDAGGKNRGAVHIIFMEGDGSVKSTVEINSDTTNGPTLTNDDRFGWSVANIGDLDGDGVDDIVAGATYDGTGGNKKGAVHIMFMESDGSVKSTAVINDSTENGPDLTCGDQFGYSVEHLDDLDRDGVNDLAVGAINDDEGTGNNLGAVHIIFMNTDGSVDSIVEINSSTTNGPSLAASDTFGTSIANIGH